MHILSYSHASFSHAQNRSNKRTMRKKSECSTASAQAGGNANSGNGAGLDFKEGREEIKDARLSASTNDDLEAAHVLAMLGKAVPGEKGEERDKRD